jgi:M6 family metalloprotease-like protein
MVAQKRSYWLYVFVLAIFFISSGSYALSPTNAVNRKVAVIYLKHTAPFCFTQQDLAPACEPKFPPDVVATVQSPRHTASEYTTKFNASVRDYFYRVSFNQVNLSFYTISNPDSADGWFDAPHKLWHYNQEATSGASIHQDGVDLAYSIIGDALADYDILLVVHNIHFYPMGYAVVFTDGQPAQMQIMSISTGGKTFNLGLATAAEGTTNEELFMVIGHELGHVHSLRHVQMGDYDLMGNCIQFNHFGGWSKLWAGWEPGVTEMPCVQGPCEITTTLIPLEYKGNNILRIPYVENPFIGYFVECRSKVNHDENIPMEGVLITHIDTITDPGLPGTIIFPQHDGDFTNVALSPGEYFLDVPRELMIMYEAKEGSNGCRVKVVRDLVTLPDPSIRKGNAVETSASYIQHESRDIWIDSPQNGWDVYPAGYVIYTGGKWVPMDGGDPFWVGHENRIRFAVSNSGYGVAENIQVNVYVDQSVLVTTPGIACTRPRRIGGQILVGSVTIDRLEMGEYFFGYVPWTPQFNSLAKVTVEIPDYPDEITDANNIAYETIVSQNPFEDFQQSLSAGGLQGMVTNANIPVVESIAVQADENCPTPSSFLLKKFEIKPIAKKDWVVELLPEQAILDPGTQTDIRLISTPPDTAKPGDCREVGFTVYALMDDIHVPVDTVGFKHCVVELSQLTCSTPSEPLESGSSVPVNGLLTPAVSGARIALEFTSPTGETLLQNPEIEKDGAYKSEFLPESGGEWKVQAFWQGDDRSAPAESEPCYFTIANSDPQFIPNNNINCRSGPGTDYEVITFGGSKDVMDVEARSPDALWLFGRLKGLKCWISYELGKLNVDRWGLPVQQPPEKPAQTTVDCETFTTEARCLRHSDVCKWVPAAGAPGKCVDK